jgi:hypothetical protein
LAGWNTSPSRRFREVRIAHYSETDGCPCDQRTRHTYLCILDTDDEIYQTAITLISDYLYVMAMLRTTPLVVTVGISMTIPLAVLGDYFLGKPLQGQVILGALLVLFSFVAIGVENSKTQETDGRLNLNDDIVDELQG